jgi:acyl-CoA thioesterase
VGAIGEDMAMSDADLARRVTLRLRETEGPTRTLGLELEAVDVGFARVSMTVTPGMLNGVGTAHGGVLFTLADTAFAYACNSRNHASVAQHAAISFLAPAHLGDVVTAEAREVALEGRSGVYSVRIARADGGTVAMFEGLSRTLGRSILESPSN